MAEYIDREAAIEAIMSEPPDAHYPQWYANKIKSIPAADVAPILRADGLKIGELEPVRHGRWIEHEETPDDAYLHHKCSECNVNAPFDYNMREDWDEGMDGEWDSLGLVDDGINEHLTDYCPNCGAKMDLEG